jgi:hypothetical protein
MRSKASAVHQHSYLVNISLHTFYKEKRPILAGTYTYSNDEVSKTVEDSLWLRLLHRSQIPFCEFISIFFKRIDTYAYHLTQRFPSLVTPIFTNVWSLSLISLVANTNTKEYKLLLNLNVKFHMWNFYVAMGTFPFSFWS